MNKVKEDDVRNNFQDFLIWKSNAGLLYDYAGLTYVKTPSMSLEWLKQTYTLDGQRRQLCILGTYYKDAEVSKNLLKVCSLPIPPKRKENTMDYSTLLFKKRPSDGEKVRYEGFGFEGLDDESTYELKNEKLYSHGYGEVNRVRVRPDDDQNILATSTVDGIRIFRLWESGTGYGSASCFKENGPIATLQNDATEILWLSWNHVNKGLLFTCGVDSFGTVWNVDKKKDVTTFGCNSQGWAINAGVWLSPETVCAVDEGGFVRVFDSRLPEHETLNINLRRFKEPYETALNALDVHPTRNHMMAVGGDDKQVALVDLRKPNDAIAHEMPGHTNSVQEVYFHPTLANTLVSSDNSNKVLLWDLSNIGLEQTSQDETDGVPELIFTHAGHCEEVFDVRWNPLGAEEGYPYWIGSTSQDYTVQSYIPRKAAMDVTSNQFEETCGKVVNFEKYKDMWLQI